MFLGEGVWDAIEPDYDMDYQVDEPDITSLNYDVREQGVEENIKDQMEENDGEKNEVILTNGSLKEALRFFER